MTEPKDGEGPYSIGSEHWPGLGKLIEECGEVLEIAGKLIQTNGQRIHWDGRDLVDCLERELADLSAAMYYTIRHNEELDMLRFFKASQTKQQRFETWHSEAEKRVWQETQSSTPG